MNLKSRSTRVRLVAVAGALAVLAGGGQLTMSHANADPDPCAAEAGIDCTDASLAAAAMPGDETGLMDESADVAAEEAEEPVSDEITVKAENWDAVSESTLEVEGSATDEGTGGSDDAESTGTVGGSEAAEGTGGALMEEESASGYVESGADDVRSGKYPTVPSGRTACSSVLGIKAPDLAKKRYVVAWKGDSSGGAPAWRLEFYHGSDPINTRAGKGWTRVDGSGDRDPSEEYVVRTDDVGPEGLLNWRMCVRNLGADNLTGDWELETKISTK
ncbi:hypothetical protein [Nonomuraea jiangxiensis]|uniref:Secreted protein n=1 Tax=Nonomuraea jiangxiensis TaxID=633440 RepID=A0A1G9BA88_9ACTN|nr:hypothetical protein [Nonomuraea jiangxiensis]SDK35970.1 hypothetical protein SAMN05421869_115194 [Nonomuraea jiangxiensis]